MLEPLLSWNKILQIVWGKMQYTKAYILWRLNIEDNKWVAKLFLLWIISFSVLLCRIDGGDAAFLFLLYHKIAERTRGGEANHAKGVSVCAKRNIVYGEAVTSLGASPLHLRQRLNIVHLCRTGRQWCWAKAQMMLPVPRKWCCALRHKWKKNEAIASFFFV